LSATAISGLWKITRGKQQTEKHFFFHEKLLHFGESLCHSELLSLLRSSASAIGVSRVRQAEKKAEKAAGGQSL
jgi:hypothetical protein